MRKPSQDRFYDEVGHPARPAGTLLRRRQVTVPGADGCAAWQVVYSSVATLGETVPVSGTVLVPPGPWAGAGPRPVLSYGMGVHGLGRDAAPSYLLAAGAEPEMGLISRALTLGWTVTVTDGEGLGLPGPHTYGAGAVGGRAMLDIVRAATGVSAGVTEQSPVLLWGYSEGGRCAAWAAELAPAYAPELDVVALAAGGVPTDLHAVAQAIDGGPYSGLGFAVLVGLAHAHRDPRLWDILNELGRTAARTAAGLDVLGLVLAHPEPMSAYTVREQPWDEPVWRALLKAEQNPVGRPGSPVYLYHARRDEIVPVELGRNLVAAYTDLGVTVTWTELDAPDHLSGGLDGAGGALSWLAGTVTARAALPGRTTEVA